MTTRYPSVRSFLLRYGRWLAPTLWLALATLAGLLTVTVAAVVGGLLLATAAAGVALRPRPAGSSGTASHGRTFEGQYVVEQDDGRRPATDNAPTADRR